MEVSTSKLWWVPVRAGVLVVTAMALQVALPDAAFAQQGDSLGSSGSAQSATAPAVESASTSTLKPNPEFAQFPRYVGMLGKRQIVMRLGPKGDYPTSVHGEYQFTDTGEVILIAGDREGNTLEAEESNDGTHITGNWVGRFGDDGSLSGDRMDVDDSNPVNFNLTLAAGQPVPPAASAAPQTSEVPETPEAPQAPEAPQPAPAANTGHQAVNGVGNLTIGE